VRFHGKASRRASGRITLELASMIDVTFLLLMYFLVTMVVLANEDFLSPTLRTETQSDAGETSDFQTQQLDVLVLDGAPAYQLGTRVMRDRSALRERLAHLPKSVGLLVRVADGVDVQFAVTAIQVARDAGFDQVTYVPAS
jgi:biopolymer transport protein ExbD